MREDAITQIYEKPLRGDLVRRSASCDDPAEQMSPPALNADHEFFAEFLDWRVAVDEAMRGVQLIFYASNVFRESDSLGSMRRLLSRDGMHTMNFHTDEMFWQQFRQSFHLRTVIWSRARLRRRATSGSTTRTEARRTRRLFDSCAN